MLYLEVSKVWRQIWMGSPKLDIFVHHHGPSVQQVRVSANHPIHCKASVIDCLSIWVIAVTLYSGKCLWKSGHYLSKSKGTVNTVTSPISKLEKCVIVGALQCALPPWRFFIGEHNTTKSTSSKEHCNCSHQKGNATKAPPQKHRHKGTAYKDSSDIF